MIYTFVELPDPEAFAHFDQLVILPPPPPHHPHTPQHLQIHHQVEVSAWEEDSLSQQRNQDDQVVPNQEEEVSKMESDESIAWPS